MCQRILVTSETKMHPLLKTFQKAIYINLDHRTDRKIHIGSELKKIGLDTERFTALEPTEKLTFSSIGHRGCVLSHRAIIQKALDEEIKNILIIEDDCCFTDDFNITSELIMTDLANIQRWDLLFFYYQSCCGRNKTKDVTSNLKYVEGTLKTHCYGINYKSYGKMLDIIDSDVDAIDRIYINASTELDVLASTKDIAKQMSGYSDTAEEVVDYDQTQNKIILPKELSDITK